MKRSFLEALQNRRTYYSLSDKTTISDQEIEDMLKDILLAVPSSFNSQSTRLLLLLRDQHKQFWEIVKDELRKITTAEQFEKTKAKIDAAFESGYGTVLFYEDYDVVEAMQNKFPLYADKFPVWSEHTSAMHQIAVWTMLEDAGMGASLQHYNPVIDQAVAARWKIPASWHLIAEMPFGVPSEGPGEKSSEPISERLLVRK